MENYLKKTKRKQASRALRVRKHLRGTTEKPRLSVLKTNKHLGVQLIDDEQSKTVASAGTFQKEYRGTEKGKKSKETAKMIGTKIAQLAKDKQIERVVFDRGRHKYHGIIAELANAAREAGLKF